MVLTSAQLFLAATASHNNVVVLPSCIHNTNGASQQILQSAVRALLSGYCCQGTAARVLLNVDCLSNFTHEHSFLRCRCGTATLVAWDG